MATARGCCQARERGGVGGLRLRGCTSGLQQRQLAGSEVTQPFTAHQSSQSISRPLQCATPSQETNAHPGASRGFGGLGGCDGEPSKTASSHARCGLHDGVLATSSDLHTPGVPFHGGQAGTWRSLHGPPPAPAEDQALSEFSGPKASPLRDRKGGSGGWCYVMHGMGITMACLLDGHRASLVPDPSPCAARELRSMADRLGKRIPPTCSSSGPQSLDSTTVMNVSNSWRAWVGHLHGL